MYRSGFPTNYSNLDDSAFIMPILIFYLVLLGIVVIVGLANYLIKGFGMYGMAKKLNIPNAWLAFIPVASNYLQGQLAGEIKIGKKTISNPGLWMLLAPILYGVLFSVLYVFLLISIMLPVISNSKMSEMAISNSIFSSFFPFFGVFFVVILASSAVLHAIYGVIRFNIHKRYTDSSLAVIHMVIGLFIPLYQSVYFLILKNKNVIGTYYATPQTFNNPNIISHNLDDISGENNNYNNPQNDENNPPQNY